jgi:hypothetical protein
MVPLYKKARFVPESLFVRRFVSFEEEKVYICASQNML